MAKTYVAMGYKQCPVCGEKHNESVLLDRSLNDSFEDGVSLFTGLSLCPKHQQVLTEGYVFIIAVDGEDNLLQGKAVALRVEDFSNAFGDTEKNEHGIFYMCLEDFVSVFEQEVTDH